MKKPVAKKRKGFASGGQVGDRYTPISRQDYDETPQGIMVKPGSDFASHGSGTISSFGGQRYWDNKAPPVQGMAKAKGGAVKKVMATRKRK